MREKKLDKSIFLICTNQFQDPNYEWIDYLFESNKLNTICNLKKKGTLLSTMENRFVERDLISIPKLFEVVFGKLSEECKGASVLRRWESNSRKLSGKYGRWVAERPNGLNDCCWPAVFNDTKM